MTVCVLLIQGITVDETRIKAINGLADKLIHQGRTDTSMVEDRRNNMNQKQVQSSPTNKDNSQDEEKVV